VADVGQPLHQNLYRGFTLFSYSSMKLLSLKMPDALVEGMDELVRRRLYPSRSAVIRAAVRDLLRKELWSSVEG
jgi:metal-responsive CopG/Arc/MetJ family transcriptional regulator